MLLGLCVAMTDLPSLKVSCLLLSGLLIYNVFWVFFSVHIFNDNVMVKVATQPADSTLDVLSRKHHLGPNIGRDVPHLSLLENWSSQAPQAVTSLCWALGTL
jgi:signal peptide peptidase-like protein 3